MKRDRFLAIDIVGGAVMVLMAIDHVFDRYSIAEDRRERCSVSI